MKPGKATEMIERMIADLRDPEKREKRKIEQKRKSNAEDKQDTAVI